MRHRSQRLVGDDPAAVVDVESGGRRDRRHPHARRPQHCLRIDDLAVVEGDAVGHHLDDLDAGMHLHTEPFQARVQPCPRLVAHHRSGHLTAQQDDVEFGMLFGDLGRRLDAGEPAAGDDDGAVGESVQVFGQQRRVLRAVQGVGEFVDAWDHVGVGDAAQRVDQGVVAQRVGIVDADGLRVGVDAGHPALDEVHTGAVELIGDLQVGQGLARRGLMQPQPLGEPGLRVDQGDVDVVAALQPAGQPHGGGHAGVSGAENQDLVHRSAFRFGVDTHQTHAAARFVTSAFG